jgi:hypothetical protein
MALTAGDFGSAAGAPETADEFSFAADAGRQITEWARGRSLGLSSASGICIALCLCATTWFTAGTRAANFRAVVALSAGYLILRAGRRLLADPPDGTRAGRAAEVAVPAVPAAEVAATVATAAQSRSRWLATLGWSLSECVLYAGLAAGAAADHWPDAWTLGITVVALVAVRELMRASAGVTGQDPEQSWLRQATELFLAMPAGGRVLLIAIVAPVWGSRAALLALLDWAIISIGYGLASRGPAERPRVPPGPSDPADGAVGWPEQAGRRRGWIAERGDRTADRRGRAARRRERTTEADEPSAERPGPAGSPWPGSLIVMLQPQAADANDQPETVTQLSAAAVQGAMAGTPGVDHPATPASDAGADRSRALERPDPDRAPEAAADLAEGHDGGAERAPADLAQRAQAGPVAARPADLAAASRLARLRDDGVLARRLGEMVRGNLLPLPPAVLGLAATAVLAYLGLRSLPVVLVMAPALIMVLVAAPGSSNRHAGRLDWLVPPVLLGWQCLYVTTVGQAEGVPGPITFVLVGALLLRYADLACPGSPVQLARPPQAGQPRRELGTALGWEGRMLLLGLGAAIGIAMYAYLALTVYLVLLVCAKILASCLRPWPGSGR